MMSVEQSVERELAEETEELGKNLLFFYQKSHIILPGLEPGSPRLEAGD
jgi:hypothetical protein